MYQTLQNFIKETLLLEDKSAEVTGQRFNPVNLYKDKVVNDNDAASCQIFFTMTHLPKVGINVKKPTDKSTPAGVYAYPLTQNCWQELLVTGLAYGHNRQYISFIKMTQPDKCLILNTQENREKYHSFKTDIANNAYKSFIDIRKNVLQSGYTSVYDTGSGLIHNVEPEQAVFLTADSYKILSTHNTNEFRRFKKSAAFNKQDYLLHLRKFKNLNDNQVKFVLNNATKNDIYAFDNWEAFIKLDWEKLFDLIKSDTYLVKCFLIKLAELIDETNLQHELQQYNLIIQKTLEYILSNIKNYHVDILFTYLKRNSLNFTTKLTISNKDLIQKILSEISKDYKHKNKKISI